MSYKFADSLRAGSGWNAVPSWSCSQAVSKLVWHIPLLCVQWKTPDDGQTAFHPDPARKLSANLYDIYHCCVYSENLLMMDRLLSILMTYTIAVCTVKISWWRTDCFPSWSCSQAVSKPVWHIPLLCVQWKTPDDGQRNCPKHVEFHSKNKFQKLVHLFGFIIRNISRYTVTWTSDIFMI